MRSKIRTNSNQRNLCPFACMRVYEWVRVVLCKLDLGANVLGPLCIPNRVPFLSTVIQFPELCTFHKTTLDGFCGGTIQALYQRCNHLGNGGASPVPQPI